MLSIACSAKTERAANNPGKPPVRVNPCNFSASQLVPNHNYTTATPRRARGAPRDGALPVHPRSRAPARVATDRLLSGAGDFHRYLDRPAGRRDRQRATHGDRTCHRAERLRTSDPARHARRRWAAVAFSSPQSRRHRAETPAMLSRRGSAIAREKRLSCHTVRTPSSASSSRMCLASARTCQSLSG